MNNGRKYIGLEDREELISRLKNKTVIDEMTGCWLWQGSTNGSGYGEIRFGKKPNKKYYIHRISAYLFLNLDINNSNIQVNHMIDCPNKNCWNFNHIYLGNATQNMQDAILLGHKPGLFNKLKTHCPRGHEYSEENTYHYKNERMCKECRK